MDNQIQALHCVAGSMWGAVLPVSRLVYAAVVRPAMTFAAPIWHSPKNTPGAVGKHVKTLTTIQNVLEVETGIPLVRDFLDKALLRSKILRGTHETVLKGNAMIKSRLQPKRGRRLRPPLPPSAEKESWAKRSLNGVLDSPTLQKRMLTWWEGRQQGRWRHYQRGLEGRNTSPAQKGDLVGGRWDLHKGLKKPESSAAVQLRFPAALLPLTTYLPSRGMCTCPDYSIAGGVS